MTSNTHGRKVNIYFIKAKCYLACLMITLGCHKVKEVKKKGWHLSYSGMPSIDPGDVITQGRAVITEIVLRQLSLLG